jgi:hypothetical protein
MLAATNAHLHGMHSAVAATAAAAAVKSYAALLEQSNRKHAAMFALLYGWAPGLSSRYSAVHHPMEPASQSPFTGLQEGLHALSNWLFCEHH